MQYMLDTNICIYLIKQNPAKVLKYFKAHAIGDIGISSIALAGLRYGVANSQHVEKNKQASTSSALPSKSRTSMKRRPKSTVRSVQSSKERESPSGRWTC